MMGSSAPSTLITQQVAYTPDENTKKGTHNHLLYLTCLILDELYFPEREFGGPAYDPEARKVYEKFSPSNFVQNWKTPTLVIHGKKQDARQIFFICTYSYVVE